MDQAPAGRQPPNSALCFPLESLLLALNRTQVDYFSLDVEGFELEILRSLPLDRLHIDVISAEFLHAREPVTEYQRLLSDHGYELYATVKSMDYIFVKKRLLQGGNSANNVDNVEVRSRTSKVRTKRQKQLPMKKVENVNIIYDQR